MLVFIHISLVCMYYTLKSVYSPWHGSYKCQGHHRTLGIMFALFFLVGHGHQLVTVTLIGDGVWSTKVIYCTEIKDL